MPLDGISVSCLSNELNAALSGAAIQKIYQPERDEVHLTLHSKEGNVRLLLSANASNPRVHFTVSAKENPASPPMFCMLLRKRLSGGKIRSVTQPDFERILDIAIDAYTELGDPTCLHLICELMGRHSNLILTDETGRIIDSVKHVDITVSSRRNILPGLTYELAPSQHKKNPLTVSREELSALIQGAKENDKVDSLLLSAFTGFSPLAGRELAYRAFGVSDVAVAPLSQVEKNLLINTIWTFLEAIRTGGFAPCVCYKEKDTAAADFWAFPIQEYEGLRSVTPLPTLSDCMEEYYVSRDKAERMKARSASLVKTVTNHLDRCKKKLAIQQKTLLDAKDKEQLKIKGDLITANLYKLSQGMEAAQVENYYEEGLPMVRIPLDPQLTPAQCAQKYYARYNKAKTAEVMAKEQIEKNTAEIEYLENVLYAAQSAQGEQDLNEIRQELILQGYVKKTASKKKPPKDKVSAPMELEKDGYTIFVGKNNRQNDTLTLKTARANDLWLHAKNIPGSHVIIKYQGEPIPNQVIEFAAMEAVKHSKAGSGKTPVDYTQVKNVKKPSGAKPGMVIYENYTTVYVTPE